MSGVQLQLIVCSINKKFKVLLNYGLIERCMLGLILSNKNSLFVAGFQERFEGLQYCFRSMKVCNVGGKNTTVELGIWW
jgi:hypothetical protein